MRCSPFTVLYDACVLYPASLRDLLVWLGWSGLYRARWTARIHEEWKRGLLANRQDITREQLDWTSAAMDRAIPDSVVSDYESLIAGLSLPDPNDRHVLAAAIRTGASVIVTFNLDDFPAEVLKPIGIEAQHPDEFIDNLIDLDMGAVVAAARNQRMTLKRPPLDVDRFLCNLHRLGLTRTVKSLSAFKAVL